MSEEGETGASIAEMIKMFIEDRKRQGREIALPQALQEEREHREQESAEHMKAMQCASVKWSY